MKADRFIINGFSLSNKFHSMRGSLIYAVRICLTALVICAQLAAPVQALAQAISPAAASDQDASQGAIPSASPILEDLAKAQQAGTANLSRRYVIPADQLNDSSDEPDEGAPRAPGGFDAGTLPSMDRPAQAFPGLEDEAVPGVSWVLNANDPGSGQQATWQLDAPPEQLEKFNQVFTEIYGENAFTPPSERAAQGAPTATSLATADQPIQVSGPESPQASKPDQPSVVVLPKPKALAPYLSNQVEIKFTAAMATNSCDSDDEEDWHGWLFIDGTEYPADDWLGPGDEGSGYGAPEDAGSDEWLDEMQLPDNSKVDISGLEINKIVNLSASKTSFTISGAGKEHDPAAGDEWFDWIYTEIGPSQLSDPNWAGWSSPVEHEFSGAYMTRDCHWKLYYTAQWVGDKYADVKVDMSKVSSEPGYPDEDLTYRVTVTNLGLNSAGTVSLYNDIGMATYVSHSASGMTCDAIGENCTISNMARNATATVDLTVHAPDDSADDLTFRSDGSVDSDELDDDMTNNAASLVFDIGPAPVELSLAAEQIDPQPARPGGTVKYRLTITNAGPYKAFNVHLTNTIPTQFQDADSSGNDNVDCMTADSCYITKILPGASETVTVEATVQGDFSGTLTPASDISIDPVMNSETSTENHHASVEIYIPPAALLTTEIYQPRTVQLERSGDTLFTSTITVTNSEEGVVDGWTTALDDRLLFELPSANLSLTTPDGMTCQPSGSGLPSTTCELNDLPRLESQVVTLTLSVPHVLDEIITTTSQTKGYMDTVINQGLPISSTLPMMEAVTYLTYWDQKIGLPGLPLDVYALTYSNGTLYAAGGNDAPSGFLARWDEDSKTWTMIVDTLDNYVYALAPDGAGGVYLGGGFTDADGIDAADRLAHYTAAGVWEAVGGGLDSDADDMGAVFALERAEDGKLYVGGHFDLVGGEEMRDIVIWDGSGWTQLGPAGLSGDSDTSGVYAIALSEEFVYLGGEFTYSESNNLIRWNHTTSTWQALGNVNGRVRSLVLIDATLYLGGEFTRVGESIPARSVAAWNAGHFYGLGSDPTSGGFVYGMAAVGKELYIGGNFSNISGTPANNVARWNGRKWFPLGRGANGQVNTVISYGDIDASLPDLLIGGQFNDVSGQMMGEPLVPSAHVGRYRTPVNDLSLTMDTSTTGISGSPITYTISAHNDAALTATDVVVWNWLPAGIDYVSNTQGCAFNAPWLTCEVGDLAPGADYQVALHAVITPNANGALVDYSYAGSRFPDRTPENNMAQYTINVGAEADLDLTLTGPANVTPGETVIYQLTALNHGPSTSTNTSLLFQLPFGGASFVEAGGATCTVHYSYSNRVELGCDLGTFEPDASTSFSMTFTTLASAIGVLRAVGTLSSDQIDVIHSNNQVTLDTNFQPMADLAIETSAPNQVYLPQSAMAYNLKALNAGPSASVDVQVVDELPTKAVFVNASAGCTYDGGLHRVVCLLATLGANQSSSFRVDVTVQPDALEGAILTNRVSISSASTNDPNPDNNSQTRNTTVVTDPAAAQADLKLTQSVEAVSYAGATTVYSMTVLNQGSIGATGVVLRNTLPAGVVFSPFTSSGSCSEETPGVVTCALSEIGNGETRFVQVGVTSSPEALIGTVLANTGQVTSEQPDLNMTDNQASAASTIDLSNDVAISMAASAFNVYPTDLVTYTITVQNNGPSTSGPILMTDPEPTGLTFETVSSPDGTCEIKEGPRRAECTLNGLAPNGKAVVLVGASANGGRPLNRATITVDHDPKPSNNSAAVTITVVSVGRMTRVVGAITVTADSIYRRPGGTYEAVGDVWLGKHYKLSDYRDVVVITGDTLRGTGSLAFRVENIALFSGGFSMTAAGILTPAPVVTYTLETLGGFAVLGGTNISGVDLLNGPTNGTTTLNIESPGIQSFNTVTFSISPGPIYTGTLGDFNLGIAGGSLRLFNPKLTNDGVLAENAAYVLPVALGSGSAPLQNLLISARKLKANNASVVFPLPEIKLGGGDVARLSGGQVLMALDGDAYFIRGSANLLIDLPNNGSEKTIKTRIEKDGTLNATLNRLDLLMASGTLTMKKLAVTGAGLQSPSSMLRVLLNNTTGKQPKLTLDGVEINGTGLQIAGKPFQVVFPDIKVGNGKFLRYLSPAAALVVAGGKYVFDITSTLRFNLPQNQTDRAVSLRLDEAANFAGVIASLNLNVSQGILQMQNVNFDPSGLKVGSGALVINSTFTSLRQPLSNISITQSGLMLNGGAPIQMPNFGPDYGHLENATATLYVAKDKNYALKVTGKFNMTVYGSYSSSPGNAEINLLSGDKVEGTVKGMKMGLVGLNMELEDAKFSNDQLTAKQAALQMPSMLGGGESGIFNIRINKNGVKIGGGKFATPDIDIGEANIGSLWGELIEEGNGYIIGLGGRFVIPLGAGDPPDMCGIKIGVKVYVEQTTGNMVVELMTVEKAEETMGIKVRLREIGLGMKGCSIPLGATGFSISRVEGTFYLDNEQHITQVDLGITIDYGDLGGLSIVSGDVDLQLWFDPWKVHLAGAITILSIFKIVQMDAWAKKGYFSAELEISAIIFHGYAGLWIWEQGGDWHFSARAKIQIGFKKGSVWECGPIKIPPFDFILMEVGAEFGEFIKGSGTVWGLKAWIKIFGFKTGFYVDADGDVDLGGVDEYILFTPPALEALRALQRDIGARKSLYSAMTPLERHIMENFTFAADQTIMKQYVAESTDVMFILGIEGDGLEFSLRSPGGDLINKEKYPDNVTYLESIDPDTHNKQILYTVEMAEIGNWDLIVDGNPSTTFFLQVLGSNPAPALQGLTMTDLGNNLAELGWQLSSSEEDSSLTIFATNQVVTDTTPTAEFYPGTPVVKDAVTMLDGTYITTTLDLNNMPTGEYYVWLNADDGRNPPTRLYMPGTLPVVHPWEDTWTANLRAASGFRGLNITWDQFPNPDADTYFLYVGREPGVAEKTYENFKTTTAQAIEAMEPGEIYYLWVEAVDDETGLRSVSETILGVPAAASFNVSADNLNPVVLSGDQTTVHLSVTTSSDPAPASVGLSYGTIAEGLTVSMPEVVTPTVAGTSVDVVISTTQTLPSGVYAVPILVTGEGREAQVLLNLTVENDTPTFNLVMVPNSLEILTASAWDFNVQSTALYGLTTPIQLNLEDVPDGMTFAFNPAEITPGEAATLTITDTGELANGEYDLTIFGMAGFEEVNVPLHLNVDKPGFSMEPEMDTLALLPGGSAVFTFDLDVNDWSAPISLTVDTNAVPDANTGLMPLPDLYPEPTLIWDEGSGQFYLEVRSTEETPAGSYTIDVTAASVLPDVGIVTETASVVILVATPSDNTDVRLSQRLYYDDAIAASVIAGDQAQIRIDLTNLGPNNATSVVLNDRLPDGVTLVGVQTDDWRCNTANNPIQCYLASLSVGETATALITLAIDPNLPTQTRLENLAIVTLAEPDNRPSDNQVLFPMIVEQVADLAIRKTAGSVSVVAGEMLTYTLSIQNHGPSPATTVGVREILPDGVTLAGLQPSQGECTPGESEVMCNLGNLAPQAAASIDLQVNVLPEARGVLTNTASVYSLTADVNTKNDEAEAVTPVNAQVDLSILQVAAPTPIIAGESLQYILSAANNGPSQAQGVIATLQLPKTLTDIAPSSSAGDCQVVDAPTNWVVICSLGEIDPAGLTTIMVSAQAASSLTPADVIESVATVIAAAGEEEIAPLDNTVTLETPVATRADLAVVMEAVTDTVKVNETLTYTIWVSNQGPSEASQVELSGLLPVEVSVLSATPEQGTCDFSQPGILDCALGDLPNGETLEIEVVVQVSEAARSSYRFAIEASSATPDSSGKNNKMNGLTLVLHKVDLSISAVTTPGTAKTDEKLYYALSVANLSKMAAKNAHVRALVPAVLKDLIVQGSGKECTVGQIEIGGEQFWQIDCAYPEIPGGQQKQIIINSYAPEDNLVNPLVSEVEIYSQNEDPNLANNFQNISTEMIQLYHFYLPLVVRETASESAEKQYPADTVHPSAPPAAIPTPVAEPEQPQEADTDHPKEAEKPGAETEAPQEPDEEKPFALVPAAPDAAQNAVYLSGEFNSWGAEGMSYRNLPTASFSISQPYTGTNASKQFAFRDDPYDWDHNWGCNGSMAVNSIVTATPDGAYCALNHVQDRWYSYVWKDVADGQDSRVVVMETSNQPVSILSVSQSVASGLVSSTEPMTITINLSAVRSAQEKVYIRYSTDSWATFKVVEFTQFEGTVGTASIPAQPAGTTVEYYVLSTTAPLSAATPAENVDLLTLAYKDNGGVYFQYTPKYGTRQSGNWSNTAVWPDGILPGAGDDVLIAHAITLDVNGQARQVSIRSDGSLEGSSESGSKPTGGSKPIGGSKPLGQTLTISDSGSFNNYGFFDPKDGLVSFAGRGTVSGVVSFNNVQTAGALNFGSSSTVEGTFTLLAGGSVNINPPTYSANSTLSYNPGGAIAVGSEWKAGATSGMGVPYNVVIASGTASLGGSSDRRALGKVTIASGAALALTGLANLEMQGGFTNNGTFTHNNRTLEFHGSNAATLDGSAPLTLYRLDVVGAGPLTLAQNATIATLFIDTGGKVIASDATPRQLTLTTALHNNQGTFDPGQGKVIIGGSVNVYGNSVTFYDLDVNNALTLSASSKTIQGTLSLNTSGAVFLALGGGLDYAEGSKLRYQGGSLTGIGSEWAAGSELGVPHHVQVSNNTQLDFGALAQPRRLHGNLTVDAGSSMTLSSASAGVLHIGGDADFNGAFNHNNRNVVYDGEGSLAPQKIGVVPYANLIVDNPAGAYLPTDLTVNGTLTVTTGTLDIGTHLLSLNGPVSFSEGRIDSDPTGTAYYAQAVYGQNVLPGQYGNLTFNAYAKLFPSEVVAISALFNAGSTTAASQGTVEYNGNAAQTMPAGLTQYTNLTIDNPTQVTGPAGLVVSGTLEIKSGDFRSASTYKDVTVAEGTTLTAQGDFSISGDWVINGAFVPGLHTVTFDGSAAQSISGSAAIPFYDLVIDNTTDPDEGGVSVANVITVSHEMEVAQGKFTPASGSVFEDIEIGAEGVLAPTGDVTLNGDFDLETGGQFLPGEHQFRFAGGATQTLTGAAFDFHDLWVASGATLDAGQSLVTVTATLTNQGVIREARAVTGIETLGFNLTLPEVEVTTPGTLSLLTIERRDQDHPNANSEQKTGKYWSIAPTGTGVVNLTLPQADLLMPKVCRYSAPDWDCASTGGGTRPTDGTTVTRAGIGPELNGEWTVGHMFPLTVTVQDASRIYGAANPAFNVNYQGFIDGDTSANLGGSLVYTTTARQDSPVGEYPVEASGYTSEKYVLTYLQGKLDVTKAESTATISEVTADDHGLHAVIYFTITTNAPSTLPIDPATVITVSATLESGGTKTPVAGAECSAPLSQGYCQIDFKDPGDFDLTAEFMGDSNVNGSVSPIWSHAVTLFVFYFPFIHHNPIITALAPQPR